LRRGAFPLLLLAGFLPGVATGAAELPLRVVAEIALGGRATRLDYASYDPSRHLLFIAHLGDSAVVAVDTASRRVVARIPNVSQVHGVLAIPELGVAYASATGTDEVVAIDERTFEVKATMPGGVYPDGMAYAPDVHKLYVSDERGGTDTVIDVRTNQRIATIPLGGDVGNTQYDSATRHVFVNVQTTGDLVEIDPTTDRVLARIHLPGAKGNHGLLIDAAARRAFIACEDNHRLLTLDLETRTVVSSADTGEDPDVLDQDPLEHRLYVAAESGIVSVIDTAGRSVRVLANARLAPKAHVVAVDRTTHQVFFPLQDVAGRPVLRVMAPVAEASR
jgi:YVTN family beta-propeller protein